LQITKKERTPTGGCAIPSRPLRRFVKAHLEPELAEETVSRCKRGLKAHLAGGRGDEQYRVSVLAS
jgi:hypothetical protein